MNPHHHLGHSTLLGYASGALPTAFTVVARAHLEDCSECRQNLRLAEDIGGQLLRQQEGEALPATARDAMLARLNAEPLPRPVASTHSRPTTPRHDPDLLPRALHPYFGERYSRLRWRLIGPGVHVIRAPQVRDSDLILLRSAAGRSIPMHTHGQNELTLILKGAYDDGLGHFAAGDVADLDCDITHQPVTAPGVPCICVAATDAPLQFSGWLARLLQPLFKL
ncbi:ChrR family anti-sigma-E factor [Xanthomonadaceae bacterium JHOS43]|nr:ChrR family anti-sigma-E factor [Xanthomonadaceae bacterium JHOS43]MCX7563658.1 ChrR family anti-sigma-E factor [Xanthomonadaceae bacterium XH05]